MKDLQKKRFNDDTREQIITWLQAGGDSNKEGLIITDKQLELLDRWRYADEKIRESKFRREQIAGFICSKYNVSRDTAYKDIVNAEYIFSSSYPLNKKYWIQLRIEYLQKKINDAYIDRDGFTASRLEKELREYIKMYPEQIERKSPKTIVFNIQNNLLQTNQTADTAFREADDIIKQLEQKDDY